METLQLDDLSLSIVDGKTNVQRNTLIFHCWFVHINNVWIRVLAYQMFKTPITPKPYILVGIELSIFHMLGWPIQTSSQSTYSSETWTLHCFSSFCKIHVHWTVSSGLLDIHMSTYSSWKGLIFLEVTVQVLLMKEKYVNHMQIL